MRTPKARSNTCEASPIWWCYGTREDLPSHNLGSASNDLGFARKPAGYVPIVSEYDQRTLHGGRFLVELRTAYSERVIEEVRRRLHGTARRTVEGSVVKVTVRF